MHIRRRMFNRISCHSHKENIIETYHYTSCMTKLFNAQSYYFYICHRTPRPCHSLPAILLSYQGGFTFCFLCPRPNQMKANPPICHHTCSPYFFFFIVGCLSSSCSLTRILITETRNYDS